MNTYKQKPMASPSYPSKFHLNPTCYFLDSLTLTKVSFVPSFPTFKYRQTSSLLQQGPLSLASFLMSISTLTHYAW